MSEEKKLFPGDEGYKGGITHATVRVNGRNKDVTYVKDNDGNIIYMSETNKILGIF